MNDSIRVLKCVYSFILGSRFLPAGGLSNICQTTLLCLHLNKKNDKNKVPVLEQQYVFFFYKSVKLLLIAFFQSCHQFRSSSGQCTFQTLWLKAVGWNTTFFKSHAISSELHEWDSSARGGGGGQCNAAEQCSRDDNHLENVSAVC